MCSIAFPQESTATTSARISQRTTDHEQPIHCTGPRTPAGKHRSSQNARKHNLSAATPPPDLLQNPTYQILRKELFEEFNPNTPMLKILVDQLTFISWKLDQIPKLEHQLLATPLGETAPTPLPDTPEESPADYLTRRLTDSDAAPPPPPDPTNQLTAEHLLQDKPTPLTRLWDHHRRLLGRLQSLVRQIQQLKRQYQSTRDTNEKADRQQRRQDDDILTEYVDAMRARHRQQEIQDRSQRQREVQNEPSAPTPAQNECPAQTSTDSLQSIIPHFENSPAQNELPPTALSAPQNTDLEHPRPRDR